MPLQIDYIRTAQQCVRTKRDSVKTSLMNPGETPSHFIDRVQQTACWRTISATALTDTVIYQLSDTLRERHPELEELRSALIDYYEKYSTRANGAFLCPEDLVLDFRLHFSKGAKRQINAFTNRAVKSVRELGIEDYETVALLCTYLKFADTIREVYRVCVEPLGRLAKKLPDHLPRAFTILEMSERKALAIINSLNLPEFEEKPADHRLEERYFRLIDTLLDQKRVLRAIKYAEKQNKK